MHRFSTLSGSWAAAAAVVLSLGIPAVSAETIRLKDQTELTGDVLRVEDDQVIIGVPRTSVATIDGEALPPVLEEGVAAPAFTAKDLQGASQAVGGRNGRVTMLHFWVHWCPHCRSDAPKLQALYTRFRDNPDVRILTVNLDHDRSVVDQFIKEHQTSYPVILASEQADAPGGMDLPALYQITSFPITFLIDGQGVIRHKVSGSFAESGQDLEALITAMLPSSQSPTARKPQ